MLVSAGISFHSHRHDILILFHRSLPAQHIFHIWREPRSYSKYVLSVVTRNLKHFLPSSHRNDATCKLLCRCSRVDSRVTTFSAPCHISKRKVYQFAAGSGSLGQIISLLQFVQSQCAGGYATIFHYRLLPSRFSGSGYLVQHLCCS